MMFKSALSVLGLSTRNWTASYRILFRRKILCKECFMATFSGLGIIPELTELLQSKGIISPSPIQKAAIPEILAGRDCAIQSCTGSGKTLAYLLPALTSVITSQRHSHDQAVKVLITAPSRELCMQILATSRMLLRESNHRSAQQLIGGANPKRQHDALRRHKPFLVVGTPGRLLDMIESGSLKASISSTLILDEVDLLIRPEFSHEVERLIQLVGNKSASSRQTVLVSASLSFHLLGRLQKWFPKTIYISTSENEVLKHTSLEVEAELNRHTNEPSRGRMVLPPGTEHFSVFSEPGQKLESLRRCILAKDIQKALIFVNSQQTASWCRDKLKGKMEVTVLHGNLSKLERTNITAAFQRGIFRAMVVTDIASRGLDITGLDAVFNLDLPEDEIDYAHRAGRTNRMGGPAGHVISIISKQDVLRMERIAWRLGIKIKPATAAFGKFLPAQRDDSP